MQNNKKVSIVTTTYNLISKGHQLFFYEMFRSVHGQDYPNIEHIIVDGGSKDGSVDFIEKMISQYGTKEIKFISEKDKGINDATNKGYYASTGDYLTLMCDDDFYTRPYAISKMMEALEKENADYVYGNTWWLDKRVWNGDDKSFAYRHPFLLNAFIFRKDLLDGEVFLDMKYPIAADYDLFMRILKKNNIKGVKADDVLTVLRPGGFSQTDDEECIDEMMFILKEHFGSKFISGYELWERLHVNDATLLLLLKIFLFCRNKKIKESVFYKYTLEKIYKKIRRKIEYYVFLKFVKNIFVYKKKNNTLKKEKNTYSCKKSREWIETFYDKIYVFDMDGTLTPARKPMTEEFGKEFLPWLKTHESYIATGSDYKKIAEQLPQEVINEFTGVYCSMGNTFYKQNNLVFEKVLNYNEEMLADLENFRKNTKYPNTLFDNYIEKRPGMINFSVIGRNCPYEEREIYTAWDKENGERKQIQKFMMEKYPDYDFELGGNISIDIIPRGCGKGQIAYYLRKLYPYDKIIFLGDRTMPGGNDYALASELKGMENTQVVQVDTPDEVLDFLLNRGKYKEDKDKDECSDDKNKGEEKKE